MRHQLIWSSLIQILLQCNQISGTRLPRVTRHDFASPLLQLQSLGSRNNLIALERDSGIIWTSQDAAQSWAAVEQASEVKQLLPHPHDGLITFALTDGSTHWLTRDGGLTWTSFELPNGTVPSLGSRADVLSFNDADRGTVIVSARRCDGSSCGDVALYTRDGFATIEVLRGNAHSCAFFPAVSDRVICVDTVIRTETETEYRLMLTTDWFDSEVDALSGTHDRINGFMALTIHPGIAVLVIEKTKGQGTKLLGSRNGFLWHEVSFSPEVNFQPDDILFLDPSPASLAVAIRDGQGSTAMFRSDSSTTHFARTVPHLRTDWTIRNAEVERAPHLQGITILNRMASSDMASNDPASYTRAQSMISFQDGAADSFLPLGLDADDLHMQSEFFSRDASGLMMGVGNNGSHLAAYADSDLYVSRSAGRHWFKVLEGPHMYEFGDNSNILAAVRDRGPTDRLAFSIDHGSTWNEVVLDSVGAFKPLYLTAIPDSAGLQMMLMAVGSGPSQQGAHLFVVDFSDVLGRTCEAEDMEVFRPLHDQEACVMGRKQASWRRRTDAQCFARSVKLAMDDSLLKRCPCTLADYESIFSSPDGDTQCQNSPCSDALGSKSPRIPNADLPGLPRRLVPGNECIRDHLRNDEELEFKHSEGDVASRQGHARLLDWKLSLWWKVLLVVAVALVVATCAAFSAHGEITCGAPFLRVMTCGLCLHRNDDLRGRYKEIHESIITV